MSNVKPQKIITATPFRGSFVNLVEPTLPMGETDPSKAKYQITIVLPKNDPFWAEVAAQIKAASIDKFGKVLPNLKKPVKDGDVIVDDEGDLKYPEFAGCYTLQATSLRKPDVAGPDLKPVLKADELYSGAWYRAAVTAYGWSHATGGKGVSFSLDTVQKVKDGEPLGSGGGKASDDFADYAEDNMPREAGEASAEDLLG